jgi:hypothetical protein
VGVTTDIKMTGKRRLYCTALYCKCITRCLSLLHVPVKMKRQLTLPKFVTGPIAAEGGFLGVEAHVDIHPKRTNLT